MALYIQIGKMCTMFCWVALENAVYKQSYSARSGLVMTSTAAEFVGLYG